MRFVMEQWVAILRSVWRDWRRRSVLERNDDVGLSVSCRGLWRDGDGVNQDDILVAACPDRSSSKTHTQKSFALVRSLLLLSDVK